MYKITTEHLEKLKKALADSKKVLDASQDSGGKITIKAIVQNRKAIELIDNEYLHPKS